MPGQSDHPSSTIADSASELADVDFLLTRLKKKAKVTADNLETYEELVAVVDTFKNLKIKIDKDFKNLKINILQKKVFKKACQLSRIKHNVLQECSEDE